jgi:hypothetical protein
MSETLEEKKKVKVEVELLPVHVQALKEIFKEEQNFKPRDARDLLIIGILKQIIDKSE